MEKRVIDIGSRSLGFDVAVGSLGTHKLIQEIDQRLKDGCSCWRSDQVERRRGSRIEGRGLFAKEPIGTQNVISIKGGRIVNEATIRDMTARNVTHGSQQQIGIDAFLVGLTPDEEDVNLVGYNHSCNPNACITLTEESRIALLVTRKNIKKNEEITTDYSVSQMSNTQRFLCNCGAKNCRGIIQPRYDFLHKDFQKTYKGEFPRYIQTIIDDIDNLSGDERKKLLMSAWFCEQAGKIAILVEEIRRRQKQEVKDKKSILKLQQFLLITCINFASRFPPELGNEYGVNKENLKKFQESIRQNLTGIIEFAKKLDSEQGWMNKSSTIPDAE